MARRRLPKRGAHGRFVKIRSPRRKARRNAYFANPPRRRRVTRKRHNAYFNPPRRRRHARRRHNPALFAGNRILGFTFQEIAYAGLGFIAPPAVEGFVKGILPAGIADTTLGKYALKAGTVAGLSFIGSKMLGREAGKYLTIGGVTYIIANLVVDYAPQLFSGFGYMNPGRTFKPMAAQPFLGAYHGLGVNPGKLPERVDPNARF